MSNGIRRELNDISRELQAIINELSEVSYGVRCDFVNIGNEKCSQAIESICDTYKKVKRNVDNI